jgi:hypothetical protein
MKDRLVGFDETAGLRLEADIAKGGRDLGQFNRTQQEEREAEYQLELSATAENMTTFLDLFRRAQHITNLAGNAKPLPIAFEKEAWRSSKLIPVALINNNASAQRVTIRTMGERVGTGLFKPRTPRVVGFKADVVNSTDAFTLHGPIEPIIAAHVWLSGSDTDESFHDVNVGSKLHRIGDVISAAEVVLELLPPTPRND